MKTNMKKTGAALLALGLCLAPIAAFAQTTTTVTTSNGAFTDYVPNSETLVVRTQTSSAPLRYTVTKQTTIVDEAGAPVAIERISPGSQLAIDYSGSGERLVASRIIVRKQATVKTAPVVTEKQATVKTAPVTTEKQTTTTTTTTAPLTREEKHAVKEAREERKDAIKKDLERQEEALEKAKDKLEDDDD